MECLKKEFEMKDLVKTKFCLGLQIKCLKNGSLCIKQYIFYMHNTHPLSTSMVVRSLDVNKDSFYPQENDEDFLCPEVPYLNAIGALIYLASHTRPDISFSVNLLARFNSFPTRRHWNRVKHVFCYLQGTRDMSLFFPKRTKKELVGFADAGYLFDPYNARSETGYVFTYDCTTIS
ncbi:Retrovirus-related Pol polyprotein from transposon TNT 1-94 [Gossypium australe]|uniref:Retrovirus-related Pol polyprotein from transposon TNT 1-94 n=1 Tax=Gossypium australe TaxID=47621 RepID=A0A5B6VDF7_9ROSI|nr:Retrovirus-related Pol polyprotein from transposon TNT 1-94 [Gossypium australe]